MGWGDPAGRLHRADRVAEPPDPARTSARSDNSVRTAAAVTATAARRPPARPTRAGDGRPECTRIADAKAASHRAVTASSATRPGGRRSTPGFRRPSHPGHGTRDRDEPGGDAAPAEQRSFQPGGDYCHPAPLQRFAARPFALEPPLHFAPDTGDPVRCRRVSFAFRSAPRERANPSFTGALPRCRG